MACRRNCCEGVSADNNLKGWVWVQHCLSVVAADRIVEAGHDLLAFMVELLTCMYAAGANNKAFCVST